MWGLLQSTYAREPDESSRVPGRESVSRQIQEKGAESRRWEKDPKNKTARPEQHCVSPKSTVQTPAADSAGQCRALPGRLEEPPPPPTLLI